MRIQLRRPGFRPHSCRQGGFLPAVRTGGAFSVLVTLLAAAPALSQAIPAGPGAPADPDSPEALMAEYQQVQARLGQLQVRVIQENEDLENRRSEIDALVTAAMNEINPESDAQIARITTLSEQARAAQQAQDMETVQAIMAEAMALRSELDAAQSAAIQREDVQSEIQSFEADLMARAVLIEPEAMDLLARLEELAEVLSVSGPGGG